MKYTVQAAVAADVTSSIKPNGTPFYQHHTQKPGHLATTSWKMN